MRSVLIVPASGAVDTDCNDGTRHNGRFASSIVRAAPGVSDVVTLYQARVELLNRRLDVIQQEMSLAELNTALEIASGITFYSSRQ